MIYSSFTSSENLEYALMIVLVIVITLVLLFTKIVTEDKSMKAIDSFEEDDQKLVSKDVLCSWDFSLSTSIAVNEYKGEIGKYQINCILYFITIM